MRNEIAVLKRISGGHNNIVPLRDYFEVCAQRRDISWVVHLASGTHALSADANVRAQTPRNLYLCFDLCTGGELFARICSRGSYYET